MRTYGYAQKRLDRNSTTLYEERRCARDGRTGAVGVLCSSEGGRRTIAKDETMKRIVAGFIFALLFSAGACSPVLKSKPPVSPPPSRTAPVASADSAGSGSARRTDAGTPSPKVTGKETGLPAGSEENGPPESGEDQAGIDTTAIEPDLEEQLKDIQCLYADGVSLLRERRWELAQAKFEEALDAIADLEIDDQTEPELYERANTLLKEIGGDLKTALVAQGQLGEESSTASFLERFESIKNFKALREQAHLEPLARPDTVQFDVPIVWNQRVQDALTYLQTVAREPFTRYLERMGKYLDLMRGIFRKKNMPLDLCYLPLIESGYSPHAYSYAHAVGPWQFIASTGRLYGLKSTFWIDPRRDFVKSTEAAADFLGDLYQQYNSWYLALAAYNGGPGRIDRSMRRQKTDDFWKLDLRRQTENYVPLFLAATIIAKQPKKYGFDVVAEAPLRYDIVTVDRSLELEAVAKAMSVDEEELRGLNPELVRGVTPPNLRGYDLRLPAGSTQLFLARYEEMPTAKKIRYVSHRVGRGESLSELAGRYGTSVKSIVRVNKLGKGNRLRVGRRILIPVVSGRHPSYARQGAQRPPLAADGTYRIRRGETLTEIAQRHNVSLAELQQVNGLSDPHTVKAGARLKIPPKSLPERIGDSAAVYVVRAGDTLWEIAKKFGITIQQLVVWNPAVDPDNLPVGTRLEIRK